MQGVCVRKNREVSAMLEHCGQRGRRGRTVTREGVKGRSYGVWKTPVRTLNFILSATRRHWRAKTRGVMKEEKNRKSHTAAHGSMRRL